MSPKKGFEEALTSYQLETFMDGIPGSVYWKDLKGVYQGCNQAVVNKGNFDSKADIIGKTDFDLWPEIAKTIRKTDLTVMRQNKMMEMDETIVLKSSETMYFSSVKSPLRDKQGNVIGVIGNSVDITEMRLAKQNAEVADQAKTQFLALMSHELRIPLTGIISTASILADNDFTAQETREFAKIIEKSGHYLLTTIESILDFAKLEADKFELNTTPVNIKLLVEEIISTLAASAKEKNLALHVDYKICPLLNIISDPLVLRLIFNNLIGNAIKYTVSGTVSILVKTCKRPNHLLSLQVVVKDTGIGIPKNKLDYIFDRFSQVETGYVRQSSRQGTGLGLSIVKKLTDILKGKVTVKSKIDVGSEFTFTAEFPIHSEEKVSKRLLKQANVLTIENFSLIKNYIVHHFPEMICRQASRDDVINKLLSSQYENQMFDIVIVDASLGKKSTTQILKNIRKMTLEKQIFCLLHFPSREDALLAPLEARGFDGVIFKPSQPQHFFKQIEKLWNKWVA